MSVLSNLFPAFAGLFIGTVGLVSANVATRRLKLRQQAARDATRAETKRD